MPKARPILVNRSAGLSRHIKPVQERATLGVGGGLKVDLIADGLQHLAMDLDSLTLDPMNARLHGKNNMEAIKLSLSTFGQLRPAVVRQETGHVMVGNGMVTAMRELGWSKCAVLVQSMTDAEAASYALADNRTAELATWDFKMVAMNERLILDQGMPMVGWSQGEVEALVLLADQQAKAAMPEQVVETPASLLADRFIVPPFSVLDARQGYWQDRKRAWLSLGIQSELGRGINLQPMAAEDLGPSLNNYRDAKNACPGGAPMPLDRAKNACPGRSPGAATKLGKDGHTQRGDGTGKALPTAEVFGSGGPGDLARGFKGKTDNRAIKDHEWPATHGKKIPQAGKAIPGGGTGKNSAYMFRTPEGYRPLKDLQRGQEQMVAGGGRNPYNVYNDGSMSEAAQKIVDAQPQSGTSIFDPVLCELVYRWFCPPTGHVFDPFAGGSVRGIVASKLGRGYTGIDLRLEQAEANLAQAQRITPNNPPLWLVGDSLEINDGLVAEDTEFDLVFSCPPYADLEVYSDDPRDLSTMDYDAFLEHYRWIIACSCQRLKDDRFACFVVGDVRDKATGSYRNFVGDTVQAFTDAGLSLYNEAILVTAVGSLPIRVGIQFDVSRKLGHTHQNVLVFVKGDARQAARDIGPVEMGDADMLIDQAQSDERARERWAKKGGLF